MEHYKEEYGDAVEHNRIVHEEALRRAHARNVNDHNYTPEESAPAGPTSGGQLNWAGGDLVMTPSHVEPDQFIGLHPTPEVDHGVCGVEAIAEHSGSGRGR
jgi:hypothetical protein